MKTRKSYLKEATKIAQRCHDKERNRSNDQAYNADDIYSQQKHKSTKLQNHWPQADMF
jgi:hypothetical protein